MGTYKISNLILHTSYDYPPIPSRECDWSCIDDNYDPEYSIVGHGKTELEAIYNYLEQYLD